jgi:Protein of unknown function (DUF2844)
MMTRYRSGLMLITAFGCWLAWCAPALASLGGNASSVLEDVGVLHATSQSSSAAGVRIIEITTDNGLQVREYLTPIGQVFAVAWNGPVMPDLQQVLGSRFAEYSAVLRAQDHPGRHREVTVSHPGLVVQAAGHLRAYSGRAYLPTAVPAGFAPALIR